MATFDPKAFIAEYMPELPPLEEVPEFNLSPTPRLTLRGFNNPNNMEEQRKAKSYILKTIGHFDITKREHKQREKADMVHFVLHNAQHFSIALIVRVLLESRGEFSKTARQIYNYTIKIARWVRTYRQEGEAGLQLKRGRVPGQHDCKRRFNLELIKQAILALGSSGQHHSYAAYYRYYLELERAKNPHFNAAYSKFTEHAKSIIDSDKCVQSVLIALSCPKF
ncbi:hypothetical protein [Helicobacter sp. L8]|uniref:hypothetical protein n=1 Tax=Helicobacter sp. L8 TaxID=2316078 RepID=UPI000EAC76D7|nr:hypothetical protein [Helicobacter sp. L8]